MLVPEGVFEEVADADSPVRLCSLQPPTDEEVEKLLRTVALRVVKLLRKSGKLEEPAGCEDALDFLRSEATRLSRLQLPEGESRPPYAGKRCAFLEGFSLHANTWVHENNREGLERLCNYGARGPLSLTRLSARPDGRLAYQMKRPSSSGESVLLLTPVAFLRRVAALIPPPRVNLVRFFGVLAPNARLRQHVVPVPPPSAESSIREPLPGAPGPSPAMAVESPASPSPPRVPWAQLLKKTFGSEVLTCDKCGGKRRVVACVFSSAITAEILEHLRLPSRPLPRATARAPPQLEMYC